MILIATNTKLLEERYVGSKGVDSSRDRIGEQVWSKEMVDHETPGNCLSEFESSSLLIAFSLL